MRFDELLPIGSIICLKNAKKKLVIIGVMPIKHTSNGMDIAYDYLGVPYPEGYMGPRTTLLFNHNNIQEVYFVGYTNDERVKFINVMRKFVDKTSETLLDTGE